MPRYIDADFLKLGINKNDEIFCTPVRPLIIDLIDNMPTADVQPVKHGIWLDNPNQSQLYSYICSNCRNYCDWTYRYCPNCGSKQDLGGDSE